MVLKLLHLNIQGGVRINDVIQFVKEQDFDILHFQEVTGGKMSKDGTTNIYDTVRNELRYEGILTKTTAISEDNDSFIGNATFYKPDLSLKDTDILWLKEYNEYSQEELQKKDPDFIRQLPRNVLFLQFKFDKQLLWFGNAHLAWGPNPYDEPFKVEQGERFFEYFKSLEHPFVLSGDFNVWKESRIVQLFNTIAVNHSVKSDIKNTLNPRLHRASTLFPPGLAVDFIFTHPAVRTSQFMLIDSPDLSDHYGLSITIEV